MSNEIAIYKSTKDFIASTQKAMRSNVRRMTKRVDVDIVEFAFADSYQENARKFNVKITLDKSVTRADFDNNASFASVKIIKILAKSDDDKKFASCATQRELYAKITKFYSLIQR